MASPLSADPKPELQLAATALVLLVGVSGSGKSTFAARWFAPTQVLSSDAMRAMVADDPNDQSATDAAFELLHSTASLRLARGRLLALARRFGRPSSAIVLDLPVEVALERNAARADRRLPPAALRRQQRWLRESIASLPQEGFAPVWVLTSADEVDAVRVVITPPA